MDKPYHLNSALCSLNSPSNPFKGVIPMDQKKTYYITTPIYYPSGNMHIGHTYTTVARRRHDPVQAPDRL